MRLSEHTTEEIRAIAAEKGCRLLAIEGAGAGRYSVLRVVLERADGQGVSIEDCEAVSREVSQLLDAAEEIAHRYTLEVSSPGLDRKLYSIEDAVRFVGRRVRVKTEFPLTPELLGGPGRESTPARNFTGVLERVEGDLLTIVDEPDGKTYNVRFGDIRLVKLDFQWPEKGI